MRIHVEGDWFISGDAMDYSLERRSIGKEDTANEGKELFANKGYFPSVSSCMKALLKERIGESTALDLKGLIADVARIEMDLKALIKF